MAALNTDINTERPAAVLAKDVTSALRWRITAHSVAFVVGLSSVFIALGFSAGFVSEFLFDYGDALRYVSGALLLFMGLVMLRAIPLPWLQRDFRLHMARKPAGYAGSLLVGMAFAAGWTPCVGPVLTGIVALASTQGSAGQGAVLLGMYALGFAIPFLLSAQMLGYWRKLLRYTALIEKIGAVLLIIVALLLLSNALMLITPYLASLGSLEGVLTSHSPSLALALLAGALSFLSPCVLPILPSFLAYLTGMTAEEMQALR